MEVSDFTQRWCFHSTKFEVRTNTWIYLKKIKQKKQEETGQNKMGGGKGERAKCRSLLKLKKVAS